MMSRGSCVGVARFDENKKRNWIKKNIFNKRRRRVTTGTNSGGVYFWFEGDGYWTNPNERRDTFTIIEWAAPWRLPVNRPTRFRTSDSLKSATPNNIRRPNERCIDHSRTHVSVYAVNANSL